MQRAHTSFSDYGYLIWNGRFNTEHRITFALISDGTLDCHAELARALIERISWAGKTWPVLTLEREASAYHILGRHEMANRLEARTANYSLQPRRFA